MSWSALSATCEVWGLFKHLVPQNRQRSEEVNKQTSDSNYTHRLACLRLGWQKLNLLAPVTLQTRG